MHNVRSWLVSGSIRRCQTIMELGLHLQTCLKISAIFISTLLISQEALGCFADLARTMKQKIHFLEIEDNLIRLVLTTCTLKSHRECKRNFSATTYVVCGICCSPSISLMQFSSSSDVQARISGEPQREKRPKNKVTAICNISSNRLPLL